MFGPIGQAISLLAHSLRTTPSGALSKHDGTVSSWLVEENTSEVWAENCSELESTEEQKEGGRRIEQKEEDEDVV